MQMSNKVYDTLRWIAQILLPGIGTLYFTLSKIWGFPYATEIVGTLSALTVFIGVLLGISSAKYPGDGVVAVSQDTDDYNIALSTSVEELKDRDDVLLKVTTIE